MRVTKTHVSSTVNGDDVDFLCEPDESLLNALRDELGLTGVKEGCGTGDCGACSILLDDNPDPTETEIRYALAGNLCRCTGYDKIVRSVQEAAVQLNSTAERGRA